MSVTSSNVTAFVATLPAESQSQASTLLGAFVAYLAAQAAAAPKAAAPAKSHRPKAGTITGSVWALCDALAGSLGRCPTRKEATEVGEAKGINWHTVTTQYQAWKGEMYPKGAAVVVTPPALPTAAAPVGLVDPSGRVVA